ncbi:MAG TPA: hypothetical protein VIJ16_10530 [Gemmatimonadaceae bacterium]
MKRDQLMPDRELRDLLRRFDSPETETRTQRSALKRRIETLVTPLLTARAGDAPTWWEFTADWARTLIPLGVAAAVVAAVLIVWTSHTGTPNALTPLAAQDSLVGAVHTVHNEGTSQRLIDVLVSPRPAPRGHD